MICADLVTWVRSARERFDAVCLDVDNGPDWTVTPGNARLYDDAGIAALARLLTAGGTLAVWSATAADGFAARLRRWFRDVEVRTVDAANGVPDHVYLAHGPERDGDGG